jgi:putative membrane protein
MWPPNNLPEAIVSSLIFGVIGILLMLLGYKLFDWILPGIKFEEELASKHNIAVAIVIAAMIVGVAIVIAAAIG